MSNTSTSNKKETFFTPEAHKKTIENHKKIATHLNEASQHHLEAAKHHEDNNHEKAAKSTITAHGHMALANEVHKDVSKQHALNK
jgi:hypothetical protein